MTGELRGKRSQARIGGERGGDHRPEVKGGPELMSGGNCEMSSKVSHGARRGERVRVRVRAVSRVEA